MIFNYSQMSISDIFGFKEHLIDKKLKMVFYFMYKKLETISHNNSGMNENQNPNTPNTTLGEILVNSL